MRGIATHHSSGDTPDVREVAEGLLVRQGPHAYFARNLRLTPAVLELIDVVSEAGLGCMIRDDHRRWKCPAAEQGRGRLHCVLTFFRNAVVPCDRLIPFGARRLRRSRLQWQVSGPVPS